MQKMKRNAGRRQPFESTSTSLTDPLLAADEASPVHQQNQHQEETSSATTPHSTAATAAALPTFPPRSRNVTLTLLYTGFAFAGRSIWSQSVLATFVYLLRNNDPTAVGYITAVMGLMQLLSSFPAGILADSYRRDTLLRLASVLGMIAVAATLLACWHENYVYLVVALALWGLCWGVANTSLSALFADSIPRGERSYYFTQRSILVTLGNMFGPTAALVMFSVLGDHWTVEECATVMALGQIICFPALVLLCFFNDKYAVNTENDNQETSNDDVNDSRYQRCDLESCRATECTGEQLRRREHQLIVRLESRDQNGAAADGDDNDNNDSEPSVSWWSFLRQRKLPAFIASADLIGGLASGMSIRYFPLFFVNNLHLGPVIVQLLYMLSPLLNAIFMKTGQCLATRFGRLHIVVANKWVGIFFMIAMIAAYHWHLPTWCVCILYVLRTAFMNCTGALSRSMLMDHVPKEERGKWSALESVNMFSWSGSAALGGILVGLVGLLPLFFFTATLQLIATFPLIYLFPADHTEASLASPDSAADRIRQDDENFSPNETVRYSSHRLARANCSISTTSLSSSSSDENFRSRGSVEEGENSENAQYE